MQRFFKTPSWVRALLPLLAVSVWSAGCSDESPAGKKVDAGGGDNDTQLADSTDEADTSPDTLAGTDAAAKTDAIAGTDVKPECTNSAQCDDSNPCTTDICKASQTCANEFNSEPCDDGNPCTQDDTCELGSCVGSGSCQDTNGGGTDNTPGCDNTEWLATQGDTFINFLQQCGQGCITNPATAGQCISDCITSQTTISPSCADCWGAATACAGQACLTDCIGGATSVGCKTCIAKSCGKALGTCAGQQAAVCGADADCNDNNSCTTDKCTATFQCENTAQACDDGNPCTADECKNGQGCVGVPLAEAATCTDNDACTTGDVCLAGDCTGTAVNCDDGIDCTLDGCAADLGCGHTATDANCDDNNTCTTDVCDLSAGCTTTNLADETSCNDGLACTENDACLAGFCLGGPKTCDDNVDCTIDACDDQLGCTHTPVDSACDDDIACTTDTCSLTGGCQHTGVDSACEDEIACTTNICGAAGCETSFFSAACDDGIDCTSNFCEATGCVFVPQSTKCDDDVDCTLDTCAVDLGCTHTTVDMKCDDDTDCTIDVCTGKDGCKYTTVDSACDDNIACTNDSCSVDLGCQNTAVGSACDDNIACTTDSCSTVDGCQNLAVNSACDDNNPCTADTCGKDGCSNTLLTDYCHIGSSCAADGAVNPDNPCEVCNLAEAPTAWSAGNEGQSCSTDSQPAGTCWLGSCTSSLPSSLSAIHDGKTCQLPACDANATLPFDYSGNWTVTTTTVSTTCNVLVQATDARLQVGTIRTGSAHPLNFAGSCDYASGGQTLQIGTFVSNSQVTCEAKPEAEGVTSLELSKVTFGTDGTASGTAKVILYDLPIYALDFDFTCEATFAVTMQRVPDCASDIDCDDGLGCTTDSCQFGACKHAIAPGTCAIDGACYVTGDAKGSVGDATCSYCYGEPPSQSGWVVNQNGEVCIHPDGPGICQTGGVCVKAPD